MMKKGGKSKQKKNKNIDKMLDFDVSLKTADLAQKAIFAKNLAMMLKSGLLLSEALEIVIDSFTGRFKTILQEILKSVQSGRTLSEGFADHPKVFNELFINVTKASEASGTLEEGLQNISEQLEKERSLSSKIKSALFYPIIILVAAFLMGLGMAFFIFPKIVPLFEGFRVELPLSTRLLISFSNFVQNNGIYLLIGIIVFVFLAIWTVRQKFSHPVTHKITLSFPIVKNITRNANLARFCLILGTLLKSGININEATDMTKDAVANFYYRKALAKASSEVEKGRKLSESLEEHANLFPKMLTKMIVVGEKSGKLEETLLYLASFYELEVDTAAKKLSTAIEPILLIFIGIVVAFLALSIITPIYKITGSVRR